MSPTTPDVPAALLNAAQALPGHFAGADGLTVEALTAIQATTMSLPGGAIGVETKLKGAEGVGNLILVISGLVDHSTGEVLSRDDARTLWTAALADAVSAFAEVVEGAQPSQIHLTDAFDALDAADEATVTGVFSGQTLAAMLLAMPAKATGKGAAAELAAAVAAATAEVGEDLGDAPAAEDAPAAQPVEDVVPAPAAPAAAAPAAAATPVAPAAPAPAMSAAQAAYLAMDPNAQAAQAAQIAQQAAAHAAAQAALSHATPAMLPPLYSGFAATVDPRRIDLLRDVVMGVSVELGRTRLTVQEILGLTPGSIVELDRAAGAPVDVLVNGKLIAHGEVVVVDEEFAVRISEVVAADPGRVIA